MKKKRVILGAIFGTLLSVAILAFMAALWYKNMYGNVGFSAILFTLTAENGGAVESNLLVSYFLKGFLPSVLFAVLLITAIWINPKKKHLKVKMFKKEKEYKLYPFSNLVAIILSVIFIVMFLWFAADLVCLPEYIMSVSEETDIYDNEYVDPKNVQITFPEQKRNVIIIYLESMETSFLSKAHGGGLEYTVIPELYDLAKSDENVNFSHNTDVGGWPVVTNATWTVASLVAQTSGVPLSVPVERNTYGKKSTFLPGITNMTDILKEEGYYQAVMFGSEGNYAGRDRYYYQHGADMVFDLMSAREDGIIPHDYKVWWGMEDKHLYRYAKQELLEMSQKDQPFAFTMLTVDTHHVGGYKCDLCGDTYEEQYENVYTCASKQLYEFVEWIKQQEFYENTTVVVCGDHASMDAEYFNRNVDASYDRHIYNCFINSVVDTENTFNRVFTPMDMFPTVLAAMGCEIEGNRLGLGTNLFSDVPTLAEEYTIEKLNDELGKSSKYYEQNFIIDQIK